jgi:hypothetical protein
MSTPRSASRFCRFDPIDREAEAGLIEEILLGKMKGHL